MNRFVVFSDLHGDIDMLGMIIARAVKERAESILFAGDLGINHSSLLPHIIKTSPIPFLLVRGNCDSQWAFSEAEMPIPPQYRIVPCGSRTIFMSHGDVFASWRYLPVALSENDIFITGHTHVPLLSHDKSSPWILNPGSASRPRGKWKPSLAIITEKGMDVKEITGGRTIPKLSGRFS